MHNPELNPLFNVRFGLKHHLTIASIICVVSLSFIGSAEKIFHHSRETKFCYARQLGNLYLVKDDELLKYLANGGFCAYSNL